MKKKLLALDIGEVCIHLRPEVALKAIGAESFDALPAEIYAEMDNLECGRIECETFFENIKNILSLSSEIPVKKWFNSILGKEINGMAEVIRGILPEWEFVFLSDISRVHLTEIEHRVSFFNLAKDGVYSFRIGQRKPGVEMYRSFEARFGKPDLYVDDREINIQAAKMLGWNAVRFTCVDEFKKLF